MSAVAVTRGTGPLEAVTEALVALGAGEAPVRRLTAGSTSAVFDAPAAGAVLSVLPAGTTPDEGAARLRTAAALAQRLAFVHPHEGGRAPFVTAGGRVVLAWHRERLTGAPPDWTVVGRSLRALHDTPPTAVEGAVPLRPDLAAVDAVLDGVAAGTLGPADRSVLRRVARRLDAEVRATGAPEVLVHGDPHGENLLSTERGPVLCDTDEIGLAAAAWDLAFLVDPARPGRLGPDEQRAFETGYGAPLPDGATARTWARSAHLRRTLQDLARAGTSVRDRWWVRARLDAWSRMLDDWGRDLQPVLGQSRARHALRVARRARVAATRTLRAPEPGAQEDRGVEDRGVEDRDVDGRGMDGRDVDGRGVDGRGVDGR